MTTSLTHKGIMIALILVSAGLLAGCSGTNPQVNLEEELQQSNDRVTQLEEQARQSQVQLEMSQREAEDAMQRAADAEAEAHANSSGSSSIVVPANMEGPLLPPNAKAGECYARVLIPPVYETTSERMLVREASSTITIIPAKYEWVEETIMTREAGEELVVVPATHKTVKESILVKAASSHMVEVPAVYGTESEEILVSPAREYWKKGRGPVEKIDGGTGEIMCLVKEAAVYKTVTRTVLQVEATTREEVIPAEYKTVSRVVVDTPATTRIVVIPAEYNTIEVRNVTSPPSEIRNPIAAEYRTVSKRAMVEPSYLEWRQILCETNMNNATVLDIQKALKAKGFNPGALDGIHGKDTQAAINAFQKANSMPSGALTYETVDALGLTF